jgi:moderate conductance mechanosensitive channel
MFVSQLLPSAFIVILMIGLIIIENHMIKKHELHLKKIVMILVFLGSFIVFIGSVLLLLWIWDFDFQSYISSQFSNFVIFIEESVGKLLSTVMILFVAQLILRISKIALMKIGTKEGPLQRRKKTISRVFRSTTKYLVWTITILAILAVWGMNVVPALAGLGILGLVIGLGAQKFINDLISGFFIIFEQHFNVGDRIEVQGFKGDVIDIGLKTTKIRNWKGEIKILANGEINNLINYSKEASTAIVDFGIAYRENIQQVIDLLNTAFLSMKKDFPQIIEDPTVVGVIDLANSSINMRVIAKTFNEQHYAVERGIRKLIKEVLDENNIEIPFPQIVVNTPKQ